MIVAPGSTSVTTTVHIVDNTGIAVTGLVAASFPPVYIVRAGAALGAAVTLTNLAAADSAYAAGGVKELADGMYRFDIPDSAFTTAAEVRIIGEVDGKHMLHPSITCGTVTLSSAYDAAKTALSLSSVVLAVNTPSARLVDSDGNQVSVVTIQQILSAIFANLLGDRTGVTTRAITAALPGIGTCAITATRVSQTKIEATVTVPAG